MVIPQWLWYSYGPELSGEASHQLSPAIQPSQHTERWSQDMRQVYAASVSGRLRPDNTFSSGMIKYSEIKNIAKLEIPHFQTYGKEELQNRASVFSLIA
jgi:hypothetical protein